MEIDGIDDILDIIKRIENVGTKCWETSCVGKFQQTYENEYRVYTEIGHTIKIKITEEIVDTGCKEKPILKQGEIK